MDSKKSEELRRAAAKALRYSMILRWENGDQAKAAITTDMDAAFAAQTIEKVVSKLIKNDVPIYRRMYRRVERTSHHCLNALGKAFYDAVEHCSYQLIQESFPHHRAHPLIELFCKHRVKLPSGRQLLGDDQLLDDEYILQLSKCADSIRAEASSSAFRKARDMHVKLVRKNTKSLLDYIDALFDRWSRMIVVRLDVSYCKAVSRTWPTEGSVTYEMARTHRGEFLKYLRRQFPGKLRGYAWSLGHGKSKSFHYHWLLFIDASLSRQDITLAKCAGEYWKHVVAPGIGQYHNCNAHAEEYIRCGIGEIHYADADAMKTLKEVVAPYLTKAEYFIRLAVTKGRTFGHGNAPVARATRRGRPRFDRSEVILQPK